MIAAVLKFVHVFVIYTACYPDMHQGNSVGATLMHTTLPSLQVLMASFFLARGKMMVLA